MNSERTGVVLVGAVVVLGFAVLLFWRLIFVVVQPGQAGVRYDLFLGTRLGRVAREGLAMKLPWNRIYLYDLRLQTQSHTVQVLSREGMTVDVDMVVMFKPVPEKIAFLHKEVGPDYATRTVAPLSIGAVREYIAQHDSHQLYTTDAQDLKRDIMNATRSEMAQYHVFIDDIIVQRLTIPKAVVDAIERKLAEEQRAAAYEFLLDAEEAEAERLRIKGVGLRRYYGAVTGSLTPSLLSWRGIEATAELAQSDNTKVVIVGSGKNQLPLILGRDISLSQGETPPEAARPKPSSPPGAAPR